MVLQNDEEKGKINPELQREEIMMKIKEENADVELAAKQVKRIQVEIKALEGKEYTEEPAKLTSQSSSEMCVHYCKACFCDAKSLE